MSKQSPRGAFTEASGSASGGTMTAPFTVAHEAMPTGVFWTVRDANGTCVMLGENKAKTQKAAAELNAPTKKAEGIAKAEKPEAKPRKVATVRKGNAGKRKYSEGEFDAWLGRRIAARREECGITQFQLSRKLGSASRSYLCRAEAGQSSLSVGLLRSICAALKWTVADALAETPEAEEVARLRNIERRAIKYLDDICLERVVGKPWQELRK